MTAIARQIGLEVTGFARSEVVDRPQDASRSG